MQLFIRIFTLRVWNDDNAYKYLEVSEQSVDIGYTSQEIRYAVIGDEEKPAMVLIH
jgi:hypothetical protein